MRICECVAHGRTAEMEPIGPIELDAWRCMGCGCNDLEVQATAALVQREWVEPHWSGNENEVIEQVAKTMGVPIILSK